LPTDLTLSLWKDNAMSQIALQSPVLPAAPLPPQQWAHDIRNVLATIAVRLNTLETLSGPAGAHAADSIHDLISRVRSLCDQAVTQSHDFKHGNKRRSVRVAGIVEQVAEIVLPTTPKGFQIEISGDTRLAALIDPTDLFRIIFNLFHNAVGVAQEHGNLSIIRVHVGELSQRIVVDIWRQRTWLAGSGEDAALPPPPAPLWPEAARIRIGDRAGTRGAQRRLPETSPDQ
jgi:nitrogen-specific signal transduction histidine kinase